MDSMINDILAKIEKEKKLERERKVVEEDLKENGDEEDLNSDQSTIDDQDPVVSLRSSSPGSSQPTRSGSSLYPKGFNNGNKKKKGRRNWNEIREEKEEGQEDQADRNCSPPHNVANFPPTPFPFYAMPPMMPVMPIPMSFLFQPMLPPQPSNSGGLVNNLNNYLSLFSPQLQNNQTGYNDKVVGAGGSSSVDEIAYKERRLVGKRRNDKAEEQEYDAYQKKKRQDIVKFNDRRKVEYKVWKRERGIFEIYFSTHKFV